MKGKTMQRILYGIVALALAGTLLMLTPRACALLFPEKPPLGYHFLWSTYLAITLGLEDLVNTRPEVPRDIEAITNVEYKTVDKISLQMDIYKSKRANPNPPLVVFIHGGSWIKGKREDMLLLVLDFARRGYATATISYQLGSYPECVEDVSDAVKWLSHHGAQYGFDAGRIALVGASAGAHLAMMVAYGWPDKRSVSARHKMQPIKAVVNLFGPVDLTTPYARERPTVISLLGRPYETSPELYQEASPLHYVDKSSPPTLIIHGTSDELVPDSQADQLSDKLRAADVPCVDYRYPLWPHAMILVGRVYDHCTPRINAFLEQYLNHKP